MCLFYGVDGKNMRTIFSRIKQGGQNKRKLEPKHHGRILEVPSEKIEIGRDRTRITYKWENPQKNPLKIKYICYDNGENFEGMYRISTEDGCDSHTLHHRNRVYYIRRSNVRRITEIKQLLRDKKLPSEKIIGEMKTIGENWYLITAPLPRSIVFEPKLSEGMIPFRNPENLTHQEKEKIVEQIINILSEAHEKNVSLGIINIGNLIQNEDKLYITDLRNVREARVEEGLVEEFIASIARICKRLSLSVEDLLPHLVEYIERNKEKCRTWTRKKEEEQIFDQMVESIEAQL